MNLDKMTINIKPLSAYQAIDLGLAVARAWYGELWQLWWLSGYKILIFIGIFWVFGIYWQIEHDKATMLVLGMMVFWWLKPQFEKPLMIYLSQRLFDDEYQVGQVADTLATLPRSSRLLARLSLQRVISMPVYQLEGLSGKAATARIKVLARRQEGTISMHSTVFFVAEMVILMAAMMVVEWLFTASSSFGVVGSFNGTLWQAGLFLVYVLVVSMLTPFFVASGFVMYLCKRSLLEGWDIELTFRKLMHRYKNAHAKGSTP